MAHVSKAGLLGVLILAGSASAATVGALKGNLVAGRPLEVNVPFSVDAPTDRACASANVRYGSVPNTRTTLHVQGRGLKRNLLVVSRSNVNEQPVTVNVRVGCGAKSVARTFVVLPGTAAAKSSPVKELKEPATRQAAAAPPAPVKSNHKPVAVAAPAEPLFPPSAAEPVAQEPKADAALAEELRQARSGAATALAQLAATRKELAAVLDVVRRMSQTLITADHQVREAKAEVAHMRLVLQCIGAVLALAAAGAIWWEVNRVMWKRRTSARAEPQEPTILSGMEAPA